MGLEMDSDGYNIYVCGVAGTGRSTSVRLCLDEIKRTRRTPDDICYVNNFKDPEAPKVLYLPPGYGRIFQKEMERFVETLREKVPKVFESEVYQEGRKRIVERIRNEEKALFKEFERKIQQEGYAMVTLPMGTVSRTELFPLKEGKPVPWDQMEEEMERGKLPADELQRMRGRYEELMKEMNERIKRVRDLEKTLSERLERFDREMIGPVISEALEPLRTRFDQPKVQDYLRDVEDHLMENLDILRSKPPLEQMPAAAGGASSETKDPFLSFQVNLLVDNSETQGAPVIVESYPTYRNLFGTIERTFDPRGVWKTDFTKIHAGSYLRANGGYLILDARDALMEPGVWPALKKSIKRGEVEIQSYDPMMFITAGGVKPEPVKARVKVIMIGDSEIYQILYDRDDDFKKVFKIKADFDTVMENGDEAVRQYARFIRKITREEGLLPFHREAVMTVVEEGVRMAGHKGKISTRFHQIADLIREAAYWARKEGADLVGSGHVDRAVAHRHWRLNLVEEKIREMIAEGTILIDTEGWKVGQVNGLSIHDLGDLVFGRPSRITAQTSMGKAGVINIERESELGGPIHNKGVQILAGYLRGKYAQDKPLSMSASICFEQSYSGVEGDSASSAELYAILSSLADLPLRQDIAVTGSVNQKGEIQSIGGVNQKIEGFYDVCRIKGLTGTQGVMIPAQNVQELMLRKDVVEAVAQGKFHIIPIHHVDEGIEILTGVEAGQRGPDGRFPEGTVNALVDRRLEELAEGMRDFGGEE
jgi:ATP-dependent Lon protease